MKRLKYTADLRSALLKRFEKELDEKLSKGDLSLGITIPLNESQKLTKPEEKVEIIFEKEAYKKICALVDTCEKEIAWHGFVKRESEKVFVIIDIAVFPQIVTGSTVDTDDEKYSVWYSQLNDEQYCSCQFHGHSHVNMGVTPSGTDKAYQQAVLEQNQSSFYIFGIFNKSKRHWFNIYDKENNVLYEDDDIDVKVYAETEDEWAEEQIKQYVTERKYTPPITNTGYHYPNSVGVRHMSDYYGGQSQHRRDNSPKKSKDNGYAVPANWRDFFD